MNNNEALLAYELEKVTQENADLCDALQDSSTALDDWLNTYAAELCNEEQVERAFNRIVKNGGTLAYIAQLQETNRKLLKKYRYNI